MTADNQEEWLSLKEASARAGVSISWLRKQYRQNGLPTRETMGPRGKQKSVPLDEVVARAAVFGASPPGKPGEAEPRPIVMPATSELELTGVLLDRLFEAQSRAARAEEEAAYLLLRLDDAYAEIEQLRDALGS